MLWLSRKLECLIICNRGSMFQLLDNRFGSYQLEIVVACLHAFILIRDLFLNQHDSPSTNRSTRAIRHKNVKFQVFWDRSSILPTNPFRPFLQKKNREREKIISDNDAVLTRQLHPHITSLKHNKVYIFPNHSKQIQLFLFINKIKKNIQKVFDNNEGLHIYLLYSGHSNFLEELKHFKFD